MTQTVQLAGNGIGGVIQGNYGIYQAASDGTFTVDTRDAPTFLAMGASYVRKHATSYSTPVAPAAASATAFIASTTLSNGALTFADQPDVVRPAQLVVSQIASPGPSAGTASLTYYGNDGESTVESFALDGANVAASVTYQTSKGVSHFITGAISGLVGSGYFTLGSNATLSLPIPPSSIDINVVKENINTGDEAVGTISSEVLASIAPTTAPNGTHTYGFLYDYIAPTT